jgi:hypothetical protein
MLALGVTNAVVPEVLGGVPNVTVTPPAEYPVPVTSPVELYAVVDALTVALAKYKAALKVSAVVAARTTPVPKLWWPTSSSPLKLVQRDCVFAMT